MSFAFASATSSITRQARHDSLWKLDTNRQIYDDNHYICKINYHLSEDCHGLKPSQ